MNGESHPKRCFELMGSFEDLELEGFNLTKAHAIEPSMGPSRTLTDPIPVIPDFD